MDSSSDLSSDSNSLSIGAAVAITCVITFIVTLIATAIITFVVTYFFVKQKFAGITQDTISKQPTVTSNTLLYEPVDPPSQIRNTAGLEIQPNPAYGTSHEVIMDDNPAYESKGEYKYM